MPYKFMFGSRKREALWLRERLAAYKAGDGDLPICNLCGLPVAETDDWDESHDGVPRANGGRLTGIAHMLCNRQHGAKIVTPAIAKANRVRQRHIGASGPGLGKHPMRAGRRSGLKKTFGKGLQPRLTHAQKHAAFLAGRAIPPLPES